MTEPDVALTDYALALECSLFGWWLLRDRRSAAAPAGALGRDLALFFLGLALAALCGGTLHGFHADEDAAGHAAWSKATMLAIGTAAFAAWAAAAQLLAAGQARGLLAAGAVVLAIYAGLVLLVTDDFLLAIAGYLPATFLLLLGFLRAARRPGAPTQVRLAVWGLVLTFVAAALQQFEVGLSARWFNHNALYHTVQAVALALLFLGSRALLRPGATRADPT